MKKKVIALAVASLASGGAFAQTQVTISGAIEAHVEAASAGGATAPGVNATSRTRVLDNTSWLRFAGTEALGNGMTAYFQVESDLVIDSAAGSAWGNRNSGVGLRSTWGDIMLGHWDMHYTSQLQGGVDFGSSGALPHAANSMNITAQDNAGVYGGRISNVVKYATPNFNGLSGDLIWSADPTAAAENMAVAAVGGAKNTAWNANVRYANGPLNAFYSYFRNNNVGNTDGADQNSDRIGVAYRLPMGLKFGLVYDRSKRETAAATTNDRRAWSIPISYTTGPHGIYFSYAKAGDDNDVADTGAKNVVLGYTYSLSKRTQLGAAWSRISNDSAARYDFWTRGIRGTGVIAAGADPTSFTLGINHAF